MLSLIVRFKQMIKSTAQQTRRQIAMATLEALRSEGFAGATSRAIARIGGFNQALIFYHYGTLENALLAALDLTSEERIGDPAAHHLPERRDVPALEVLVIDGPGEPSELRWRPGRLERRPVIHQSPLADQVKRCEERVLDAAEVVEDQRLVEAAQMRDRPRARPGEPVRLERLKCRLGDLKLRSAQSSRDIRPALASPSI